MSQTGNSEFTILDHVDHVRVPGRVFDSPTNEYWALKCLKTGLNRLSKIAHECDEIARKRINPNGRVNAVLLGRVPEFSEVPMDFLTCVFHWYAVSACQYVRTVGAIAYRADNTRKLPQDYVRFVIPDVLAFRNKVAAHFAWVTKHRSDTEAERVASILPSLTFINDCFVVGAFTLTVQSQGKVSSSEAIQPWSIKDVHRRMTERYWPGEQ